MLFPDKNLRCNGHNTVHLYLITLLLSRWRHVQQFSVYLYMEVRDGEIPHKGRRSCRSAAVCGGGSWPWPHNAFSSPAMTGGFFPRLCDWCLHLHTCKPPESTAFLRMWEELSFRCLVLVSSCRECVVSIPARPRTHPDLVAVDAHHHRKASCPSYLSETFYVMSASVESVGLRGGRSPEPKRLHLSDMIVSIDMCTSLPPSLYPLPTHTPAHPSQTISILQAQSFPTLSNI